MSGDHIRNIDMSLLKGEFPDLYKAGKKIIKGKNKTSLLLKALIEDNIGMPYEKFDSIAKMSNTEIIEYFKDKKPQQ